MPRQTAAAPFDVLQIVLEFAPGAATAQHVHPTPYLATVMEGEVTAKLASGDKTAKAGETIVEPSTLRCRRSTAAA